MSVPTYMDYSATTPVDKRVAKKMMQYLTMDGDFAIQQAILITTAGKQMKP